MKIDLREERPPVPAAELEAAERELAGLGRRIPDPYKAFLADQDGGKPVRGHFSYDEDGRANASRVRLFYGVGEQPDGSLVDTAGLWMGLPEGMLAIAGDAFGNQVCLRDDGPVVFCDHEQYDEDDPEAGGIHEIAPDLPAFLDGLQEHPPDPPPAPDPPQGGRLRRLFGHG